LLETAKNILLILSALFPIVNPLGGSPVFFALPHDYPTSARRALARQVAVNSFVLLVSSFQVGTHILNFFGISIPVVQVGGGLVVISNGWAMPKQKEEPDRGRDVQKKVDPNDIFRNAFHPLTLPLTVGPGSISVAITLGANLPHHLGANFLASLPQWLARVSLLSAFMFVMALLTAWLPPSARVAWASFCASPHFSWLVLACRSCGTASARVPSFAVVTH
jgi:MarC family membrane protein